MIIDKFALPKDADRRKKLTDKDRSDILFKFNELKMGIRVLAREYGVDKKLIVFVLFPERLEHHKELAKKRREDGRYKQTADERREIMRDYRSHKKESLIKAGILDKDGKIAVKNNGSQLLIKK